MANYALTTTVYERKYLSAVLDDMETYIETVDNAKTIYVYGVYRESDQYVGCIVHAT